MPWCPKCKNEYVEGITKCADCGCELVESLSESGEAVIFGEKEQMEKLLSFAEYNGVTSAKLLYDETEQVYEIFVSGEELEKTRQIAGVFLAEEARKHPDEESPEADGEKGQGDGELAVDKAASAGQNMQGVYKDSAQKAAEFKDSGYTLLGVGIAGLAAVILTAAGILPFKLGGISYLTYGVMGVLFLIFVIVGIRSMRSAKAYKKEALTESNLKEEIVNWCRENLTAEVIDASLSMEGLSEEEKYFRRTECIKEQISGKFINIEEGFLDNLIDGFYPEIFGE